jgi:exopolysaccharide biosynthesis polyprenyl glycosylphosphotransferase
MTALLTTHPELGYRTVAIVGDQPDARIGGLKDLPHGHMYDAVAIFGRIGATGALICAGDMPSFQVNQMVRDLLDAGAHVLLTSGLRGVDVSRIRPAPLAHEPLFYVEPMTLASWQLAVKRTLDSFVASTMLVLSAPLLALAAVAIKLHDGGPVFFQQERVGRHGARFKLYKLRTMRVGAEQATDLIRELNVRDGPLSKVPNDPRVTRVGRVLRATSVDELPQLWNVINGTMSLVGPRPALPDEVARFDDELRARESVLPGLTGLWQVEGRDNPSFAAYRRFDLFYLQNWSVALDIIILLGTVESVLLRIFRGLRHLDEDIQLAPPEVIDPANAASGSQVQASR